MQILTRIFELVVTGRKLSAAKPHVLSALSSLALVIILGVFATVLAALMVSALIWLLYAQMLMASASIATAGITIAVVTLVILSATVFIALRIWKNVRIEVAEIFRSQTPLAPVTDTANAFIDGLMTSSKSRSR